MEKQKINLVHHINSQKSSKKIFLAGRFFIYGIVVIGLLTTALSYKIIFSGNSIAENISKFNIIGQIKQLITSDNKQLRGEENDRINILLLGIGGKNHEGGTLTDTNIIISIKPSTKEVALLSIPRDLYVPIAGYNVWRKINRANAYGEMDKPGSGPKIAEKTIKNVLGIPIHYYVRIDFNGFEKLIDEFGGIDVYVKNTLEDYKYPIRGKENIYPLEDRYEHLLIKKGWQHMNGALALKYARSRHALGIEGSDFARSRRQQKVLSALKNKIFKVNTFLNIKKINSLLSLLNNNITTDAKIWEITRLAEMSKKINNEQIKNYVLDDGPNNLLYATTTVDGAYILKPKIGNWSELRYLAQNIFSSSPGELSASRLSKTSPPPRSKIITIEIQNGTKINGFARKTSYLLKNLGFKVLQIKNAPKQNYEKTIVYDLTDGKELKALSTIKKELNANIALTLPGWLIASFVDSDSSFFSDNKEAKVYDKKINTRADFLIILGKNTAPIIFEKQIVKK